MTRRSPRSTRISPTRSNGKRKRTYTFRLQSVPDDGHIHFEVTESGENPRWDKVGNQYMQGDKIDVEWQPGDEIHIAFDAAGADEHWGKTSSDMIVLRGRVCAVSDGRSRDASQGDQDPVQLQGRLETGAPEAEVGVSQQKGNGMKALSMTVLAIVAVLMAPVGADAGRISLPKDVTKLMVKFDPAKRIDSGRLQKGDTVSISLAEDLKIGGIIDRRGRSEGNGDREGSGQGFEAGETREDRRYRSSS